MIIKSAEFIKSSSSYEQCPETDFPEFAFIGRSNVGKSSLLEMVVKRKGLAKIGSRPGKTRLINHFLINNSWYLVDLPGYGYGSASKSEIAKWGRFTEEYIFKRENLVYLFVLVDSRIEPQKSDLEFIDLLGKQEVPFVLISTKIDKISKPNIDKHVNSLIKEISKTWESIPIHILSSAKTSQGRVEILDLISSACKKYLI